MVSATEPSEVKQDGGIEVIKGQEGGIEVVKGCASTSTPLTFALMRERSRTLARKKKSMSLSTSRQTTHPRATQPREESLQSVVRTESEASTVQISNQGSMKKILSKQSNSKKPSRTQEELITPKRRTSRAVTSRASDNTDATEHSTSDEGRVRKKKKDNRKKIFGNVRSLLRKKSTSSRSSSKMAAKEDEVKDSVPIGEMKVIIDELPIEETIHPSPTSTPTLDNLEKSYNSAERSAVDDEGMPESIKIALKRAKFYANKATQLLNTLEQEKLNPPHGEHDREAVKAKANEDIKRAKLALRYAIESRRLYNLVESMKANKGSVVVDSSSELPLSPFSSAMGKVGKESHDADKPWPIERVKEASADRSIASSSHVEQDGSFERVSSHVIHPPSTPVKSSSVEVDDPMPLESARSDVFFPPHLSQDVESIISEMTTTSEKAVVELQYPEQKLSKDPKLLSSPRDASGCVVGLEPTLADAKVDFEFDSSFVKQERVHNRVQELKTYPGTFTATLWQPLKDGLESASSCAQDSVAATSFSKDVAFPEEDGTFVSGVSFDVQLLKFGDSHTIDEESGIDKYDALEHIADVNEAITGSELIISGIGDSDKYAVDEIIARSVVIMSDPTFRLRSDTVSSEMCEEIDVIYENSDDNSQNGSDWMPDHASDDSELNAQNESFVSNPTLRHSSDTASSDMCKEIDITYENSDKKSQHGRDCMPDDASDGSESTTQNESFTSRSGPSFDDSDDSDASDDSETSDSEASGSEVQEEIELFEESDYSEVSSRSKYSTFTDDSSESSDDTTMGEAIKREIRDAKRLFGFLS